MSGLVVRVGSGMNGGDVFVQLQAAATLLTILTPAGAPELRLFASMAPQATQHIPSLLRDA